MKIALYSPYIPKHFGGGEKYILDVAVVLRDLGHQVWVGVSGLSHSTEALLTIKKSYEKFLDTSLEGITFVNCPIGTSVSWWQKMIWTRKFDVMYYLTDGSLFFSLARKNILHIQFPFTDSKASLIDKIKLANWKVKNTNSDFTRQIIEAHWPVKIDVVHHPMVEIPAITLSQKPDQKIILSVGRFFRHLHSKRQDVLVEAFRQLKKQHAKLSSGWKLVLIGSVEDETYLAEVKKAATHLPIEILTKVSRADLNKWYQKTSVYWHAAGFDIDPQTEPAKVEHFGISTVEAMRSGCIPVVIGKGGQLEVVGEKLGELTWQTISECVAKTAVILSHTGRQKELQKAAISQSLQFNREAFEKALKKMLV
jgi:glycosyltransferase involved in cell wall biosynthesis